MMSQFFAALLSALALGCGALGPEEVFTKDSFATFGSRPDGPKVTACPWYHFDESGLPILPRGPSKLGNRCRVQTLQHYFKSFLAGGTFTVVRDGTEMWAHAGGTHDHANDQDLDSVMYNIVSTQPKKSSSFLFTGHQVGTSSLSASKVLLRIRTGDVCMPAGGYGNEDLAAPLSQEAVNLIQNKLCLCKADGVQSICYQEDHWGDEGLTSWLPMPGSKNLGRALDTYVLLEGFEGWRADTIEQLKSLDIDSNGVLTLGEVLHQAAQRGVTQDWLNLMKRVDPCRVVNSQRDLYMWLQELPKIAEQGPRQLADALKKAQVFPEGEEKDWDPATEWLRQKYHLGFLSDKEACRDLWNSATL